MDEVTCKMCGAQFNSENELMEHNATEHDMAMPEQKPEGEVVCQICGMAFVSSEERDKHNSEVHPSM